MTVSTVQRPEWEPVNKAVLEHYLVPLLAEQMQFYQSLKGKVDNQILQHVQAKSVVKDDVKVLISESAERLRYLHAARVEQRQQGAKRIVAKVEKLAIWADDFLETFSGIAEICRGIDNQFGSIAYGTLSVFLTIARNRKYLDEYIVTTLRDLKNWLPRLELISDLEKQNETIRKFVLEVHQEMVKLLRCATHYLCGNWFIRNWKVIIHPPQVYLRKEMDQLKENTKDLLTELATNLYAQVHRIEEKMEGIGENLEEATQHRYELDDERHTEQLTKSMRALQLPPELREGSKDMVAICRDLYSGAFCRSPRKAAFPPESLEEMTLDRLARRSQYRSWRNTTISSLLILSGENFSLSGGPPCCWLSPVAVELFESICGESANGTAFFHSLNALREEFRRQGRRRDPPEVQILLILKSIIYQLLASDPKLCTKWYDQVVERCQSAQTGINTYGKDHRPNGDQPDLLDLQMRMLFSVLGEILANGRQSSDSTCSSYFIILDGIEQLSDENAKYFFSELLKLLGSLHEKRVTVKVLAICQSVTWPRVRDQDDVASLRYELGQGGNRDLMKHVLIDPVRRQRRLKDCEATGSEREKELTLALC